MTTVAETVQEFVHLLHDANLGPLATDAGLMSGHDSTMTFTTPPRPAPARQSRASDQKMIIGTAGSLTTSPQTPADPGSSTAAAAAAASASVLSTASIPATPKSGSKSAARGRKRAMDSADLDTPRKGSKRQKMTEKEKNAKGLRHFSLRVCEKVKDKGTTTYNEVAEELVIEQQEAEAQAKLRGEELDLGNEPHGPKNIRRRVYDALNVLMAMNIISKERKEIKWIGLPNNSTNEFNSLEELRAKKMDRIRRKTAHLQELIVQQVAFKNLVKRNEREFRGQSAPSNALHLPFIVVNTPKQTVIDCQMAEDKSEYFFDFSSPFEIHDDIEILKRMGLAYGLEAGTCSVEDLAKAEKLVPKNVIKHLHALQQNGAIELPPSQDSALATAAPPPAANVYEDDDDDDEEDDDDDDMDDD